MTTYHGNGGSVTFATNAIGELVSWTLETSVPLVDDSAMGDVWGTVKAGSPATWSGTAVAHIDYDDTAQAAIIADIMNATPSGDSIAMEFLVATAKAFDGNAIVNSVSINQSRTDIVDVTFSFTGNGQLVPDWT